MTYKFLEVPFEFKGVNDDGTFEGLGAVFGNLDLGRDIIAKGAFKATLKSLADRKQAVKMLWQHNRDEPIGIYTEAKETDDGLLVKGKIVLGVQRGREAHELMKAGAVDSLSIGYRPKVWNYDKEQDIRTLTEVDLREISVVTFPMNEEARITAVKSEVRDFEEWLTRDAGFTRSEALIVINKGYKAYLASKRDAGGLDGLADALRRSTNILSNRS